MVYDANIKQENSHPFILAGSIKIRLLLHQKAVAPVSGRGVKDEAPAVEERVTEWTQH